MEIQKNSHVSSDTLTPGDAFPMLEALCCNSGETDGVALTFGLLRQGLSDPDQTAEVKQTCSLWRCYLEQKQPSYFVK